MESHRKDNVKKDDVDWSRFGLGAETSSRTRASSGGFIDLDSDYGAGGHQASGANELFAEHQVFMRTYNF